MTTFDGQYYIPSTFIAIINTYRCCNKYCTDCMCVCVCVPYKNVCYESRKNSLTLNLDYYMYSAVPINTTLSETADSENTQLQNAVYDVCVYECINRVVEFNSFFFASALCFFALRSLSPSQCVCVCVYNILFDCSWEVHLVPCARAFCIYFCS